MNVYDFKVKDGKGNDVSLEEYRGKVLMIINSATECGFTPQYDEIREIYDEFAAQGFTVLDFPCNQFGNQAPGSNEEIAQFCTSKYGVKFPIFSKIDVNGENADPLYKYLTQEKSFQGFGDKHQLAALLDDMLSKQNPDYKNDPSIKWNFTKFIVDRNGKVVARFEPTVGLDEVKACIEALL